MYIPTRFMYKEVCASEPVLWLMRVKGLIGFKSFVITNCYPTLDSGYYVGACTYCSKW